MTSVKFFADKRGLNGFEISGHSSNGCDDFDGKIVCAAVSSAAYMAVNTISEVVGDKVEAFVDEAIMVVKCEKPTVESRIVLNGLKLHFTQLAESYSNNIKIFGGAKDVKD